MRATSIIYQNEKRIQVAFPYSNELTKKMKEISGAKWSRTLNSWHVPYSKQVFEQLLKLFPDIEIVKKTEEEKTNLVEERNSGTVTLFVTQRSIRIKLPKNEADTQFILSLRYSRWDKKNFCWVVPSYGKNLELIKSHFGKRINSIENNDQVQVQLLNDGIVDFTAKEFLVVQFDLKQFEIYFAYNKDIFKKLNSFPYSKWNPKKKCLTIPFQEKYLKDLEKVAIQFGLIWKLVIEKSESEVVKYKPEKGAEDYRVCPPEYALKLQELRYSIRTIKSYKATFEEFINYYKNILLKDITDKMIVDYLQHLVVNRKISTSYQNTAINSIKFYYERVLGGERKIYLIDRPRKEQTLPVVLNQEEISLLIKKTENLKHKAIIMIAYSAGLRLSEIVDLKIKDIDSVRMQIRVEQGKGKKDRFTLLSRTMLAILRKYFTKYEPKEWLFEGSEGGKYSGRSIQQIVKAGVKKAGIKKKVSVHTLRHTFATHLLENGTDLRYIQNLLGHESSKTTEIYTHITTKGFDQIKSPLDGLGDL